MTERPFIYCHVWVGSDYQSLTAPEWQKFNKGQIHRENQPAVIFYNNSQHWYRNGKLHREDDKPAIVDKGTGCLSWFINGKLHRINKPARVLLNGYEWYNNGVLHRTDGPAIVDYGVPKEEWRLYGTDLSNEKVKQWINENIIDLFTPEGLATFKLKWS